MSCLDNLIGVKGCESSGSPLFYINQLTGINIPDFDKALSLEQRTAKEELLKIISFSTKLVEAELNTILAGKYQLKSIIDNDVVGYYYDNKVLMPTQPGVLTGYEIRVDQVSYLSYFLQELRLFANHTGDVPVYIYDLLQGKLLDTITVTAVSGEIVSVSGIDKSYSTSKQRLRLFIGYDSTFQAYNTAYASPYGSGDYCNTCSGSPYRNSHVQIRAARINVADPKTAAYVSGNNVSGGAGLSLGYSLQCSFTEHLCNIRNRVALPILYKSGSQVMKELKHSKRLTGVVTIYGKSHDELMQEYEADYAEKMGLILNNMNMPESLCFSCTPKVRTQVVLP